MKKSLEACFYSSLISIRWMTHSYVSQRTGTFISKKGMCMNTGEASASSKAGNKARKTGEKPVPFQPRRSNLRDQRPIYNVTCSAPISFSLCFPISPCLLFFYVLSQAFIKHSRKAFVYICIYINNMYNVSYEFLPN